MSTQSNTEFSNTRSEDSAQGRTRSADARTTEQARKVAHDFIDTAAGKAGSVETKLREEASRLGEVAEERKEEARRQLDAGLSRAEAFARERPLAAAGIAFAAGALAALALRRS